MNNDQFERVFTGKERVMVVLAHPDDAEIYAGGTIARLTKSGVRVRVVKVTSGNKGSRQEEISETELRNIREDEDAKAMEILGVDEVDNVYLGISDGSVENNLETIGKIAQQIRIFKPDLIITHNPEDMIIRFDKDINWVNHRDHRNTGKSTIDASYPYSRDLLFYPEHFEDTEAESHSVIEFLLVDYYDHIDEVMIDVTDFLGTRIKALASHKSQYSKDKARETTDFLTGIPNESARYERFRYVVTD
jgi:LmbE family N-acetylglucosaminyl deacetylase